MADPPRDPGGQELPARVTMPLLTLITQQSLDEDYLHVAERRATGGPRPAQRRPRRITAVVVAVFGILVATAAVQTSRNASVNDAGRATLVSRITERRDAVSALQGRLVSVRQRNALLQDQLSRVTDAEQAELARLRRLEVDTGFIPVTGEGVRITVDDTPGGDVSQLVRDTDLRLLVDGLWNAGAEAIAINGKRLTALSAIRNTSVAINVNSQPMAPPYTVEAIGDTRTLQADLLDSTHGSEFFDLAQQLGFVYSLHNEDSMTLPAAPEKLLRLRHVEAGTAADRTRHVEEDLAP